VVNGSLSTLNLAANGIGGPGVAQIVRKQQQSNKNEKQPRRGLCFAGFGDEGAMHLAKALEVSTSLASRNLRCCGLTGACAAKLAAALEVNT
jgi:hypothetical protein